MHLPHRFVFPISTMYRIPRFLKHCSNYWSYRLSCTSHLVSGPRCPWVSTLAKFNYWGNRSSYAVTSPLLRIPGFSISTHPERPDQDQRTLTSGTDNNVESKYLPTTTSLVPAKETRLWTDLVVFRTSASFVQSSSPEFYPSDLDSSLTRPNSMPCGALRTDQSADLPKMLTSSCSAPTFDLFYIYHS